MARITGPLFSMSASGTIGKTLTYGGWKGIEWVKMFSFPTDLKTPGQLRVRRIYRVGVDVWNALSSVDQDFWNDEAKGKPFTGFNLFLRNYLSENLPLADFAVYGVGKYGVDKYGI